MEISHLALWALGIVQVLIGWFAREVYSATQRLRRDLTSLEVQINRDYVRHDRLQEAFRPIMEALQDIKEALRGKQDKP